MLEFLIDNVYVEFSGQIFQKQLAFQWVQTAPFYLPTYFLMGIRALKTCKESLAQKFNFTYIYDGLSLNNSKISEFIDLIYPCKSRKENPQKLTQLEIKDTTESTTSVSYLDFYLCTDNRKLVTRLFDKRHDFNFPIVNFPFLCTNIPSASAYGVYVSQLVLLKISRLC